MNVNSCKPPYSTVKENKLTCETDFEEGNLWKQMSESSIFVTVGTTSFDRLIDMFNSYQLQSVLINLGYKKVIFQIGRGSVIPKSCSELIYDYFTFKDDIKENLIKSDLVVSHAGAGTCLEVCKASVRLLVVVNDMLMHNHQTELAIKLAESGHCIYCSCSEIQSTFDSNYSKLKAGIRFGDVFSKFETDYYKNVAADIEELF